MFLTFFFIDGYVDGMSLYAGYFGERFWVDPTGTVVPDQECKYFKEWGDGTGYEGYCCYTACIDHGYSHKECKACCSGVAGSTCKELKLEFKAFIHKSIGAWFLDPNPLYWSGYSVVAGDNRGFGESGTSRLYTTTFFDPNTNSFTNSDTKSDASGRGTYTGPNSEPSNQQWETEKPTFTNSIPGHLEHKTVASGTYPFDLLAPAIDYTVKWSLTHIKDCEYEIEFSGSHDKFPFYEVIVDGKVAYKYSATSSGPNMVNLNSSLNFKGSTKVDLK